MGVQMSINLDDVAIDDKEDIAAVLESIARGLRSGDVYGFQIMMDPLRPKISGCVVGWVDNRKHKSLEWIGWA